MTDPATEFGGQEAFAAEPARLYALLTDLNALTQIVPDLVSSERSGEREMRCVVRPGFSFLRGTLKLAVTLADLDPPRTARMKVAAQGIGVSMEIESYFTIAAEGRGSRLWWNARIDRMKGLVASVSPGLVKAAADRVVRHAWQQVRRRLGE